MSIQLTSCLLWIMFISRVAKGQSNCDRTNRQPNIKCVPECNPATGCGGSGEQCLCDGDCGYSCVKKGLSCGRPPPVFNAKPEHPSTNFGAIVTYVCNKGFTLTGASQRTCRANGRWDGVGPNCLQVCTVPDIPFSMYIAEPKNYNRTYSTGDKITLACKKGFKKKAKGNPVRICISGRWTQFPFECEGTHKCKRTVRPARTKCTQECSPESGCGSANYLCLCDGGCGYSCVENGMSCGDPPAITNGKLNSTGTAYNSTAHYTCDEGYSLNTAPVKRCTAKKRWSGLTPRCMKDCEDPVIPRYANISNPSDKYNSGYKVTFKCNEGYNQEGIATQMCFQGKWTVLPFKCSEGGCGDPGTPTNGRKVGVSYSVNSRVYFGCDLGYELVGSEDRKCQTNGSWTGQQPVCTVVDCGYPPRPINGRLIGNQTKFQSVIQFECEEGYDLIGADSRMCTSDKNWSGKEVTCEAVDCRKLSPPMNGSLSSEKTTYPTQVEISCDEGFILRGSHRRKCQANRTWNGTDAFCDAVNCGPLLPPKNGSSTGEETTFTKTKTFKCDAGFDLIGSSSRSCMADKTWNGTMPVCKAVDCRSLPTPMNGSLLGEETTYPNQVEISCNEGFILRGSRRRTCQVDRTWSGDKTSCEAVDCGLLAVPRNGSVEGSVTVFPYKIEFSCDEGFILEGSATRKCQANATWSGNTTLCRARDCGNLPVPVNGSHVGNQTTYPNKLFFICHDGFDLIGSSVRNCEANGKWSEEQPTCNAVDCGPLPILLNGSQVGNLTTYPNEVKAYCDEGFLLRGSAERVCQANRTWNGIQTTCEAVDCGLLSAPLNGSVEGSATVFPNLLEFSCDSGFTLEGPAIRRCQANGTWSGRTTLCKARDCGNLPVPKNGSITGTQTTYPNKLYFSCDDGFNLIGSTMRKCKASGRWSGEQPTCKAVDCGRLSSPLNGTTQGSATVFPNVLGFSCDSGFILEGSAVRTCQANGTWSGRTTLCQARDCGKLPVPTNGSIIGNQTTYPNRLSFSCDDGFDLIGSIARRCEAGGNWSGQQPTCKAVDCGPLPFLLNGSHVGNLTIYPNKVISSCDEGFLLRGAAERSCQANRTWSGIETNCEAVDCGPLGIPVNGSIQGNKTYFPNVMKFACDKGFIRHGSDERQCEANGSWSGNQTLCKAVDCGQVQPPMNGSLLGSYTFFPNKLHFYCDVGFILRGSSVRSCLPNATWSGTETKCEAKNCGSLITPKNGSMFGRQTTFPSEVRFSCEEGFLITGPEKRKCQADGSWSGNITLCAAVDCGRLLVPVNGSSHGGLTVFPENIRFSCDTGFIMSGSPLRHCRANGTWSGNETSCNAVDCGRLPPPVNGSVYGEHSTYPNTIEFTCDDGFTLHGATRRHCQSNGTWSGRETICQANDCGPLAVPRNGSSVGNMTTYPNKKVFSCDEGFILIGSTVRQCQANKSWNGLDTYCKAIDCGPLAVPINGSSAGNLTVFPNKKLFMCDPGYILGGSSERVCQANGTWSGTNTSCTAIDCGFLFAPRNGSIHGEHTTYPNTVRFSCDEGFTLLGSTKRTCQTNGVWSGTKAVCKANDCGPLAVPRNGSSVGNSTTYPNKIVFSCDEGFVLIGSAVRQCQANKTWNGLDTYCRAVDCGPLRAPVNGSLIGNLTVFPNSVQFACDLGFILTGSVLRTCQANGTWGGLKTACSAVDCGPLVVPKNGSVFGEKTIYPNLLRFKCDEGFTLHGSHARKCQANGTWRGVNTFCQANDCGRLSDPMNGTSSGNLTTYPNKVTFTCDDGFILQGSTIRQCQPNKRWSGNNTVCEAKDCGPLAVPVNGSSFGSQTTFPHPIIFSCDEGFIHRGSGVRKCQSNGTWSGNESYCEAKDCGALDTPTNGSLFGNLTTYPNEVKFACDEGYNLRGSKTRQCLSNGNWSGNKTLCEAEDCGPLRTATNGSSSGEKTTYPNRITFRCDDGFILRGSVIRRCQPNGTWSGEMTFCEAKNCGPLHAPINGSSLGNEFTFPNKITFKCDEGFILKGSVLRKCQSNGQWTGNDTFCEAVDCGPLSSPMNGSLSGNLTVYPNSVRFKCDPGFILRGSSLRKCQSNGTWDGYDTVCEAVDCGKLHAPQNGTAIGRETTYPNIWQFSCDEGFILRGSSLRKCQTNGTWSGNTTKCQAQNCGPLPVPRNGSLIGDLTSFPNKILFDCDEGFNLRGSRVRQCQANGMWSGNQTFCEAVDCGPLSVPMNGSSSCNSTVFPDSVLFKCDPGFILNGSSERTCQSNGTWSGLSTVCVAVDCGQPQPFQNGSITGESTVYPNVMQLSCDEGFILRGSTKIQCQTNGTWSKTLSFCKAKDCGLLSVPLNGSYTGSETTFPNKVTFRCDEGFILIGSKLRRCRADGSWSGNETSCEAVDCGPLSVPLNGSSTGDSTVFPNSVLFNCDPGFSLNGSSTRTCQANGTWSGLPTTCFALDCGPLTVPTNGSSIGDLTIFPNKILFGCDEGFNLSGSNIRHCQENGTWSGHQTFCEAVDCGPLSVPMNGSSSGDSTVFPDSVEFNCDHGFILNGFSKRTCQANGSWSGFPTICVAVDCGPLYVPMNGSSSGDSTVFPNSVLFNCDPGFILNGSSTRTCQANGTWSGLSAECVAVDCGQPQALQNGIITGQSTVYPNVMQISCDEGFILRGSETIQCQTNGNWSKISSFCEAKDCGPLFVPVNGSYTGLQTTFPNEASFSCDEGFILHGSMVRRCQSNGTWSGKETFCEAVDCGLLSVPMNGSSSGNSTEFPNSVLFKCDPGFILHESSKRTCQANGTWSGLPTTCVAQDCGPLSVPTNGSSTGDLTIFPNKILFDCDDGFNLRGSLVRQCQANGIWSGNQTFCEAVDCGPLSVPMNGSYTGNYTVFPNSVHFNCDSGFIINGSVRRTCQANGTWSGVSTECNAVDCGSLSVPMNGSFIGGSTVFPNSVIFTCDPGFILNGSSTRTCQANRTWNGYPAICFAVDCGQAQPIQNGSIIGGSTVYPNVMRHICEEGFVLRGSPDIRCQTNGSWSKTSSFCEARDCGPLTVPVNGSYYGSKTTFPNVATFSCDEGFVLNGSTARQCQADGYWSGSDTSCQAVDCGPLSAPWNGALLGNLTFFPNRVQFFCNNGYVLNGSSSRKCLANGTWSGMQTACTPIDCGPLQPLLNGTLSGEMTDYPNIVKLTCDMGFILHGPPLIKCQANGTWSWIGAFCEAKNCGQLPKPLNGTVFGSETTYPNKLEFKCDEGFQLQGSSTRKCEADGQWSGQEVTCQAVDCGPITVPEHTLSHGNSTTYPSVITFSCRHGFFLHGESTRMCQSDGQWTSGEVSCRGMNCGPLTPPEHGWMFGSKTTHPHNMSFTCAAGYRLVGPSQRTCLRNGSWSGQQPKCLAYWCSKAPEVPVFAYQTWRAARLRYEHGERIYYSCKAGFIMVGIPVRFCNLGQWSAVTFNCSAPSCNAPTVPKLSYTTSARGSQNKYLNGEKVYYSCHSGYELVGIPMVECQNGVWTYPSFSCQPVACGTLPKPSNGAIQRNTGTTYTALYVFRCNAAQGYIMRGSVERRCLANATWSGVQPVCYMQTCDPRGKPRYGKVTPELSIKHSFGDTVHYQCNDGFSVRGHKTARCQIYGNWSNPVPECISCSLPLGLKNRMIFSSQLSASSERDSRHRARHGRLHGNSAWCSARSGLAKFFQIDFGRTTEVTAIATQGHPKEYKWVTGYVLKYSLGKLWLTYQESGRDKVFQGNRDRNTVIKHYLKERLVTKQLRILRHQNSQDFMGSTVCLRAEVYGCYFDSDCLDVGSEVFARWNSLKKHTRYFHGFITKIRKTSVEVTPSGNHGAKVNDIRELPRAEKHYVVIDTKSKPAEITTGAKVIVASEDNIGFSQGKVGRIFGVASWFEVQLSNKNVWRKANQIRLLKSPIYCDRE